MKKVASLAGKLKRKFVQTLGKRIERELGGKGVSEKDVMDDFKAFKKKCRHGK